MGRQATARQANDTAAFAAGRFGRVASRQILASATLRSRVT